MSTVSFTQIASDVKIPGYYGEITTVNSQKGLYDYPTRILVIGQKLAAGTAVPLTRKIVTDEKLAKEYFGKGSNLALMVEATLKNSELVEVHAIAQDDDGAAVVATGDILVTNAATVSGTLYIYIAGQRIKIKVLSTDAAANIATNITAAINAEGDLPVTAAVNGGTSEQVDVTAKNKGLTGNDIKIITNYQIDEDLPQGMSLTVTQLSGGSANPDIDDVFSEITGEWFTDIAMPYTDAANLNALEAELADRYSAMGKMDAHAYCAYRGTHAEIYTFGDGRNSALVSCIPLPNNSPEPAWIHAAALCGRAASWSDLHPARPYKGLVLSGVKLPRSQFTFEERQILLSNGIATWVGNANGQLTLERIVTMYQENEGGIEDETWLDITTPKTFSHIRYDSNAYVTTLYFGAEGKILTKSETAAARADHLVTPKTIDASMRGRAELWIDQGLVSEVLEIRSEVDSSDPTRVNQLVSMDITNPLMILAQKLDMRV